MNACIDGEFGPLEILCEGFGKNKFQTNNAKNNFLLPAKIPDFTIQQASMAHQPKIGSIWQFLIGWSPPIGSIGSLGIPRDSKGSQGIRGSLEEAILACFGLVWGSGAK